MKTNQNEFVSAILDDEAGAFERRRLLGELCDDAELGKTLNRYSLVGEAMRSQQKTIVDSGSFLAGIQAQLEDEPVYNDVLVPAATNDVVQGQQGQGAGQSGNDSGGQPSGTVSAKQPWYRDNTARYAMAASVAVAALAGVILVQNTGSSPDIPETMATTEVPVVKSVAVADAETTAAGNNIMMVASKPVTGSNRMTLANANLGQQTADTLKQYVTLHMQYRSSNGIAPSIQAVSYAK